MLTLDSAITLAAIIRAVFAPPVSAAMPLILRRYISPDIDMPLFTLIGMLSRAIQSMPPFSLCCCYCYCYDYAEFDTLAIAFVVPISMMFARRATMPLFACLLACFSCGYERFISPSMAIYARFFMLPCARRRALRCRRYCAYAAIRHAAAERLMLACCSSTLI